MDVRLAVVALFLVGSLTAGCLNGGPTTLDVASVPFEPLALLPGDRAVAASMLFHEEPSDGEVDLGDIRMLNEREPRDVALTYHGVQPAYDEWGREVPAIVFRYSPMTIDVQCDFVNSEFTCTGEWIEMQVEYLFDAADGRFMGAVYLDYAIRSFADPEYRDPIVWTGEEGLLFLFMAHQVLGGDLSKPIPIGDDYIVAFSATDDRPMKGSCDPYEVVLEEVDPEPTPAPDPTALPGDEEESRTLVCFDEHGMPLWAFDGTSSEHLAINRLDEAIGVPAFQGAALPPVQHERVAWETVDMLVPVVLPPVTVPAVGTPGDYADIVRPIVPGVSTDPEFLQYQAKHGPLFLQEIHKAFPYFEVLNLLLPDAPRLFEETSWVFLSEGEGFYWGFVDSRYGSPEEPDLHASQRGVDFDIADWTFSKPADNPLVPPGTVQTIWESIAPADPGFLTFLDWPTFGDELDLGAVAVMWSAMGACFEEKDGELYVQFSALTGQMLSAGGVTSHENGCSSGAGGAAQSGGGLSGLRVRRGPFEAAVLDAQPGKPAWLLEPDGRVRLLSQPTPPGPASEHAS